MDSYIGSTRVIVHPKIKVNKARRGYVELEFEGKVHELDQYDVLRLDIEMTIPKQPVEVSINPHTAKDSSDCRCACCKG